MPASHHAPSDLAALGRTWVDAWNSHDLERVLSLYAEDTEMTSDRIPALGFAACGTLRGKESLRAYWSKALTLIPNLHFTLIDTYVSPDSGGVLRERARQEDLRISAAQRRRPHHPGLCQPSGALIGSSIRRVDKSAALPTELALHDARVSLSTPCGLTNVNVR